MTDTERDLTLLLLHVLTKVPTDKEQDEIVRRLLPKLIDDLPTQAKQSVRLT